MALAIEEFITSILKPLVAKFSHVLSIERQQDAICTDFEERMRSEIAEFDNLAAFLTMYHTTFELIEKCGLVDSEIFFSFLTNSELRILDGPIPLDCQELVHSKKFSQGQTIFQRQDIHELLCNEQQHAISRPPISLHQFEAWFTHTGEAFLTHHSL